MKAIQNGNQTGVSIRSLLLEKGGGGEDSREAPLRMTQLLITQLQNYLTANS